MPTHKATLATEGIEKNRWPQIGGPASDGEVKGLLRCAPYYGGTHLVVKAWRCLLEEFLEKIFEVRKLPPTILDGIDAWSL